MHQGKPVITSLQNPRVKMVRRLHERRHRLETGLTFAEGWRALDGLWRAGARFHSWWTAEGARPPRDQEDLDRRLAHVPHYTVSSRVFAALAGTVSPQGVIAVIHIQYAVLEQLLSRGAAAPDHPLLLVLDGLQDPGNAGALVRAALATGATGVVTTPGTVDLFGPKALRGAAGLTPACPVVPDVPREALVEHLERAGVRLLVLDAGGAVSAFETDWRGPAALVVGSEGRGASEVFHRHAVERVRIPMLPPVESLNAAVSAAVCLYEAARQRKALGEGFGG